MTIDVSYCEFKNKHWRVTDWTLINQYESRYHSNIDAIDAMQKDIENKRIDLTTKKGISVVHYVNKVQEDLDALCCKYIFG